IHNHRTSNAAPLVRHRLGGGYGFRPSLRSAGMTSMNAFLETFFKPNLIAQYLPSILKGVVTTIEIALAVVITGLALGLVLAVVRSFQLKLLNALIVIFVDMFRALPPLVIVLIVYFGLPNIGISIPSFAVLWLVLC